MLHKQVSKKSTPKAKLGPILEVDDFDPFLTESRLFMFVQVQILLKRLQVLVTQRLLGQVDPHIQLPLQHEVHAVTSCVYVAFSRDK